MQACEFITVEEVAERLHISRATLFNWMQKGIFTQGKHFFKRGRVLRFIWGDDLISALMGDSQNEIKTALIVKPALKPISHKNDSALNWDY